MLHILPDGMLNIGANQTANSHRTPFPFLSEITEVMQAFDFATQIPPCYRTHPASSPYRMDCDSQRRRGSRFCSLMDQWRFHSTMEGFYSTSLHFRLGPDPFGDVFGFFAAPTMIGGIDNLGWCRQFRNSAVFGYMANRWNSLTAFSRPAPDCFSADESLTSRVFREPGAIQLLRLDVLSLLEEGDRQRQSFCSVSKIQRANCSRGFCRLLPFFAWHAAKKKLKSLPISHDFVIQVCNTDSGLPHCMVTGLRPDVGWIHLDRHTAWRARTFRRFTLLVNFHPSNTSELTSVEISKLLVDDAGTLG